MGFTVRPMKAGRAVAGGMVNGANERRSQLWLCRAPVWGRRAKPKVICRASGGPWAASAVGGRVMWRLSRATCAVKVATARVLQLEGAFCCAATLFLLDRLTLHLTGFTAAATSEAVQLFRLLDQ